MMGIVEGPTLSETDRLGELLDQVSRLLERAPDDAQLLFNRAAIFAEWGRIREALAGYADAEFGGMRGAKIDLAIGQAHLAAGDASGAEIRLRNAASAEPTSADAAFALGTALFAQHRWDEAASSFQRGCTSRPDEFRQWHMLGSCVLQKGDPVAADEHFRRAIACDGRQGTIWKHLALALNRQGRSAEARDAFLHAVRLEHQDENGDSFVDFARFLIDAGEPAEAIALLESFLPQRPLVEGHYMYALALLTTGRLSQAWPN